MPVRCYYAVVERGADGFGVVFPDLPGCTSAGDTVEEALRNAAEALAAHLELLWESGDPLPAPSAPGSPLPDWLDDGLEIVACRTVCVPVAESRGPRRRDRGRGDGQREDGPARGPLRDRS